MEECITIRGNKRYGNRNVYTASREARSYNRTAGTHLKQLDVLYYSKRKLSKESRIDELRGRCTVLEFRIEQSADTVQYISAEKKLQFKQLADKWTKEASGQSSMSQALTPTYLKILTLGKEITPLILKELDNKPNFWFLALRTLNDVNPVPKEHMGNVLKMREDWLFWGKKKQLI